MTIDSIKPAALATAAVVLAIAIFCHSSFGQIARPFKSGEELARLLIAQASAHRGIVDLSIYAQRACFVPEGAIYPPSHAMRLLPGFEVVYLESTQTDGYWFLLLGSEDQKKIWIFAVRQSTLQWPTSENARAADLARCLSTVRISTAGPTPQLQVN